MNRATVTLVALALVLASCNAVPTAPVVSITPDSPGTQDALVAGLIAESADDNKKDVVSYRWSWSVDGDTIESLIDKSVASVHTAKGQVWEVTVTPSDGHEIGPSASASVTVQNSLPTADVRLTPGKPVTTDTLAVTVETDDADHDPVEVHYAWSVDGVETEIIDAQVPAELTNRDEVWTVTVTPVETVDQVEGEAVSSSVTIANTPPQVESAWLEPDVIYEETVVACVGEGWLDLDGDPEAYEVEWFVDGVSVSTDASISGDLYDKGQKVQ